MNRQGTVLKKCDCPSKSRCAHGWTLRYWADGRQRERTFRDTPGKLGSGKKLAEDFALKLAVGKREGDVTFADKSKGAVRFTEYAEQWIAAHKNAGTRAVLRSTLKLLAGELGNKTLAQVAGDREGAQKLIDDAPGTYARKVRILLVSPCNEALKSGRLASHRLRGLKVEEEIRKDDFTPATRAQLDQMASELGDRAMIIWLGVYAGLRIGETLAVNIGDFIMDGHVLRVQRQRGADGSLTANLKARKEGDFRDVPVSRELWRLVQAAPRDADGYLFPAEWRPTVMNAFRKSRDAAGLPSSYTPHSLRDQYATTLLSNLVSVPDVAKFLGHRNIQVTFAYYHKAIPSAAALARDVIDRALAA
jgi:integrase